MHRFVGFIVTAAVLLLAVVAVAAQNAGTQVIGGDESALRELLSRAFVTYPSYTDQETAVYVGRLPEDLPFELTLPDNIRVIGSIDRGDMGAIEIILDSKQSPEAAVQFFSDRLSGDDWRVIDPFPGGGFTTGASDTAFYCSTTSDLMINVSAFEYDAGTDIRVYVTPGGSYACDEAANPGGSQEPFELLPQLHTPAGVELLQGGSSGGGGGPGFQTFSTQAYLQSDLPLDEIVTAYNAQLEAVGWHLVGQESADKLAWSGWTIEAENRVWGGTLTFTASPTAPNQYIATLSILETPANQ
jgi:hypothetical protein